MGETKITASRARIPHAPVYHWECPPPPPHWGSIYINMYQSCLLAQIPHFGKFLYGTYGWCFCKDVFLQLLNYICTFDVLAIYKCPSKFENTVKYIEHMLFLSTIKLHISIEFFAIYIFDFFSPVLSKILMLKYFLTHINQYNSSMKEYSTTT